MKYILLISFCLPWMVFSQDIQKVYDLYNGGDRIAAWQYLKSHEQALFDGQPAETAYLFTKIGWVVYAENPDINSPQRIGAIHYAKKLFEVGDSIYKAHANDLLIDLLSSLKEDMDVVLDDYSSSINRANKYLTHFSADLIPVIPVMSECGFLNDGKRAYNYGVILNNEAEKIMKETEHMSATPERDELEEKVAILYVAAFRLINSACSLGDNFCDLSGFELVDDPASKAGVRGE